MLSDPRVRRTLAVAAAVLLSACLKPPRHEPEVTHVAPPVHLTPFETATLPATIVPTPTATPTTAGTPTQPPPQAELPPLTSMINNATPPNVAAALRLVEEGRASLTQQAYDRALDRFERALVIDPSNAYAYYFLARLHVERRSFDQAIAFADKAGVLAAHDDRAFSARAYELQGEVFEHVGRYPDARAAYRRALVSDGNNLEAQTGLSRLGGSAGAP